MAAFDLMHWRCTSVVQIPSSCPAAAFPQHGDRAGLSKNSTGRIDLCFETCRGSAERGTSGPSLGGSDERNNMVVRAWGRELPKT